MSSTQSKAGSLLSLLDRRFSAKIPLADFARLALTDAHRNALFKKGILAACRSDQVDSAACPLGDHVDDGTIPLQREADGRYRGLCKEHGQVVTVPEEAAEWAEFNAVAWARTVCWINKIKGELADGSQEIYRLGAVRHKGRNVEIAVVSGYAPVAGIAHLRPSSGADLLLCIDLGDRVNEGWAAAKDRASVNASAIFQEDLFTLRESELIRLTAPVPVTKTAAAKKHIALKYTGAGKAVQLTEDQYLAEIDKARIKKQDLFIDMVGKPKAWRNGILISKMAKARKKKSNGKRRDEGPRPLSPHGLGIIAHYLVNPGRACAPIRTEPYQDDKKRNTDPHSAQIAFDNIRKALKLADVIQLGQTIDGVREYSFQRPAGFNFVLLVKPSEPATE